MSPGTDRRSGWLDRTAAASLLLGTLTGAPDLPAQDREVERWRVSSEPILEIGRMSGPASSRGGVWPGRTWWPTGHDDQRDRYQRAAD